MRKLVVMAMAALGATAAFTACQKDGKVFSDPKIEFRDAENKVITEFTKENKEIKVLVTLGDKSLKIKKYEAKVEKPDGGKVNPELKLNFAPVKGGIDDGKFEAKFTFADTKILDEKDPIVKVTVVDSKDKSSKGELPFKTAGGTTPDKTAKEKKGWVNNNLGTATGGYSLSGVKAVASDATDADVLNVSETGKGLSAKLVSKTGLQFARPAASADAYTTATPGSIAALGAVAGPYTSEIADLKENELFIAKNKTGETFYLIKVTKIVTKGKDFDGSKEIDTKSTKGNGGYMTFSYKSNK